MSVAISINPHAIGLVDDGSESGALRTRPLEARMISQAFRCGSSSSAGFRYEASGGASVTLTARVLQAKGYLGTVTSITCPAGDHSYVKVRLACYGRRFGLRWYYVTGQPTKAFTVVIDGQAYEVPTAAVDPLTGASVAAYDPLLQWLSPLLDDSRHDIEIIFTGDRPTGSSNSWLMFAVLLDGWAGYEQQQPIYPIFGPWTVGTGWDTFAASSPWDATNIRIRRAFFRNGSGSSATVYLAVGAGNDANIFHAATIAAGATSSIDLDDALWFPVYLKASAGSAISAFLQAQNI